MRRNRDLPVFLSPTTTEIEKEMRVWPLNNTDNLLRGGEPGGG